MKLAPLLFVGALCAVPLAASAQWQWLDSGGRKVFSDKAPPLDVPEKNIIKRPGGTARVATTNTAQTQPGSAGAGAVADPAATPPAVAGSPAAAPAGQDKELLERTRQAQKQAEDAAAAKKKAEADQLAKTRAENCSRANQAKASLDSGMRIATVNAKGEREIMDDAARAAEMRRVQQSISANCGPG